MMGVQHKLVGIGFGVATAIYVSEQLGLPGPAVVSLCTSTIGCMLPDIDHDMSKIGRKRKMITSLGSKATTGIVVGGMVLITIMIASVMIGMANYGIDVATLGVGLVGLFGFALFRQWAKNSSTFKWMAHHRGLMHTLIPPAFILIAAYATSFPFWKYSLIGLFVGYCSHLLADMLTVEGCPILWPFTRQNIHLLPLKTKNASTWIAAILLAASPVAFMVYTYGGGLGF